MEKIYAAHTAKVLSIMPEIKQILENGKSGLSVEQKSGVGNIVTSVDKQLEEYISRNLSLLFPDALIISEESADDMKNEVRDGLKFVVDPLDGTTNYTNGWPHAVAIGMIDGNELISGVVYDVLDGKVYTGIKGVGVTECSIDNIKKQKKVVTPAYSLANPDTPIKKSVISYDTPYGKEAYEVTKATSAELYHAGASLKTVGPMALDVLKTALGRENRPTDYNHATWHSEVRAWDLAASTAILRELGGDIIGRDGKPLSTEILSSPSAKIAFIASGSEPLRKAIYQKYRAAEKKRFLGEHEEDTVK